MFKLEVFHRMTYKKGSMNGIQNQEANRRILHLNSNKMISKENDVKKRSIRKGVTFRMLLMSFMLSTSTTATFEFSQTRRRQSPSKDLSFDSTIRLRSPFRTDFTTSLKPNKNTVRRNFFAVKLLLSLSDRFRLMVLKPMSIQNFCRQSLISFWSTLRLQVVSVHGLDSAGFLVAFLTFFFVTFPATVPDNWLIVKNLTQPLCE